MENRKVTLISGVSRGIGRNLAEYFLGQNHTVIGCSRSICDLKHPQFHWQKADVSHREDVLALFAWIQNNHGRLDHLINNAGAAAMNHFLMTPVETARGIMEVNYLGTFLMSQEAARLMQKNRFGRIVNFTSLASRIDLEGEAAYAAAKAAVASLTRVMAKELGSFGITVNAISPGPIRTGLIIGVADEKLQKVVSAQAIPRFGNFDDVSHLAQFLLDARSEFITGQEIGLGGL